MIVRAGRLCPASSKNYAKRDGYFTIETFGNAQGTRSPLLTEKLV